MKNNNLWKIIWIIGIYAILIVILYLVVKYKVKWEYLDLNKYLYFYNCSNELCTSQREIGSGYYNRLLCENDECPFVKEINDEYNVILSNNEYSWIYNYYEDKVVNNNYDDYHYLGNGLYNVTNDKGLQGIINLDNQVIVEVLYEDILEFKDNLFVYKENDKYGIKGVGDVYSDILPQYQLATLINDKYFAYLEDNRYNIVSYESMQMVRTYDYLLSIKDMIIVADDGCIDILDSDLNSKLIMKIPSLYNYTIEKERDSLKIYSNDDYIYFNVVYEENKYKTYKYDLNSGKIYG